jgi:hypothetical protein
MERPPAAAQSRGSTEEEVDMIRWRMPRPCWCFVLGAALAAAGGSRVFALEVQSGSLLRAGPRARAAAGKIGALAPAGRAGLEAAKLSAGRKIGPGAPDLAGKKPGEKVLERVAPAPYAKPPAPWKAAAAGGGAGIAGTVCEACPSTAIDCGGTAAGALAEGDCQLGDGSFFDLYRLVLPGQSVVTIEHVSSEFDAYLFLADGICDVVAQNDDCAPGNFSSCLTRTLAAGTYFILANSFSAGEAGAYELRVTCEESLACADCQPADIACGETKSGVLAAEDCARAEGQRVDYYRFELAQPGPVRIELRSVPLDPLLLLFDDDCAEIALNDDCQPGNFDLSCLTVDLAAGTYYIGASSLGPGETGDYEVEVTCPDASPCRDCEVGSVACGGSVSGAIEAGDCALGGSPADVWRLDLAGPTVLDVRLTSSADLAIELLDLTCQVVASSDGCTQGGFAACLSLRQVEAGTYHLRVKGAQPGAAGAYDLSVDCAPFDPCQSCLTGAVACGGEVAGALSDGDCFLPGDGTLYDVWSFNLAESLQVSIDLRSTDFDTYLLLLDSSCEAIASSDNCTGTDSCLVVNLPVGDYLLVANSAVPGAGTYTLSLSCGPNPICEEGCRAGSIACGGQAAGELAPSDCPLGDGSFIDAYSIQLDEPQRVAITLASSSFDAYLLLFDSATCEAIAANDDCDGTNSCLMLDLPPGEYLILANSLLAGATGQYTLGVACSPNPLCTECRAGSVPCNGAVSGTLPETGCRHQDGSFIDVYDLDLLADGQVDIQLTGAFDTFLFLVDSDCNVLATNDDCTEGDTGRSCLSLGLTAGAYAIWVNSFAAGATGDYTLEVSSPDCAPCESCRVGEVACDVPVEGMLPASGCLLPGGRHLDLRDFTLAEAAEVTITVASAVFDPSVTLYDGACAVIASNDDCGTSTLDACLTLDLEPGAYSIGVSNFLPGESGAYSLSVSCGGGPGGRSKPGDCNKDGVFNISDGLCVLGFLFSGVPATLPCGDGGLAHAANISMLDFDGGGSINITDGVAMFLFLFSTGDPHPLGQECQPIADCEDRC